MIFLTELEKTKWNWFGGKDKFLIYYVEVCISTVKLLTGIILKLLWNLETGFD